MNVTRVVVLLLLGSTRALAAEGVNYDVSLRTEAQLRSLQSGGGILPVASLEVLPLGSLDYHAGGVTRLGLSYAPRFLVQGPADQVTTQLLHRGRLLLDTRFEGGFHFSAVEQVSYGTLDFVTAATSQGLPNGPVGPAAPTAPLEALPTVSSIFFQESATELATYFPLDRRTQLLLTASYLYSGGVTPAAQATLPLQIRPQATAEVDHQVTREDQLATSALASYSTFDSSVLPTLQDRADPWRAQLHPLSFQSVGLVEATETWRHRLNPLADFSLGAGASFVRQMDALYGLPAYGTLPVVLTSLRQRLPIHHDSVDLEVTATLGPYIDRLVGSAYERVEASAQGTWNHLPSWSVRGRLRSAVAVFAGPEHGTSVFAAEGMTGYLLRRDLKLEAGARVTFQREQVFSPQGYFEYVGFVSFTLAERGSL